MEEQPNEIEVGFEMNKILTVCLCPKEIAKSQGRVGKGFVVGYSRTSTKDKNREGEEKSMTMGRRGERMEKKTQTIVFFFF